MLHPTCCPTAPSLCEPPLKSIRDILAPSSHEVYLRVIHLKTAISRKWPAMALPSMGNAAYPSAAGGPTAYPSSGQMLPPPPPAAIHSQFGPGPQQLTQANLSMAQGQAQYSNGIQTNLALLGNGNTQYRSFMVKKATPRNGQPVSWSRVKITEEVLSPSEVFRKQGKAMYIQDGRA